MRYKKYVIVKRCINGYQVIVITKKLWKDKKCAVGQVKQYRLHADIEAINAAGRLNIPVIF